MLLNTPDEFLQAETNVVEALVLDKINNEFNIEPEDQTVAVYNYKLEEDENMMLRM